MANAKWSGIEQWKYGLTADWYVSAKYGYATDEGGWGLYNRSTNPDGWGGPKRPFDGLDTALDGRSGVFVLDSGKYTGPSAKVTFVGDGDVVLYNQPTILNYFNLTCIMSNVATHPSWGLGTVMDCKLYGGKLGGDRPNLFRNVVAIEASFNHGVMTYRLENCSFIKCRGLLKSTRNTMINCMIVNSPDLNIQFKDALRPVGELHDYSIIIGTVKSNITVNGKATGSALTLEDFKADGQYFRKSYSEVDLFGNESGSGASVAQLNTIFNNFYYPYIDDWQYLDLSLRPDVDDRVRYGGLNGHFIGALPVGYHFDIPTLWNTYKDADNTTNVELNASNRLIRTNPSMPGVYTSTLITLPSAINETDVAMFFKNNVYDSNGVAVQRLDYSADPDKDAALEQRTVYSYRMKTSPDDVTPLTDWKEYELDRAPTIDDLDRSNLDPNFDVSTQKKQPIKRFIIEITLRSE